MKNKKMKPDNNNLDAIAKQARQLPKAGMGLNFIGSKLMDRGMNNIMGGMASGAGIDKSAKTQKLEEKATSGLGIFKPFAGIRYKANLAKDAISSKINNMGNQMGQMASNPLKFGIDNVSKQTGLSNDQVVQLGMKAGMAAAGVPPIGFKKGGSVKKKKK